MKLSNIAHTQVKEKLDQQSKERKNPDQTMTRFDEIKMGKNQML